MAQERLRKFRVRHYDYVSVIDDRYPGKMVVYVESKSGEPLPLMIVPRLQTINAHKWLASRLDTYINFIKDMSFFGDGKMELIVGKNVLMLASRDTLVAQVISSEGEKEYELDNDGLPKAKSKQGNSNSPVKKKAPAIRSKPIKASIEVPIYQPLKQDIFEGSSKRRSSQMFQESKSVPASARRTRRAN